jgi:natural product precursor
LGKATKNEFIIEFIKIFNYFCMKKINLKEISKIMSESEMKDVKGGNQGGNGGMDIRMIMPDDQNVGGDSGGRCTLKCDQDDPSTFHYVDDCSRATAEAVCGDSFNPPHTICVC